MPKGEFFKETEKLSVLTVKPVFEESGFINTDDYLYIGLWIQVDLDPAF